MNSVQKVYGTLVVNMKEYYTLKTQEKRQLLQLTTTIIVCYSITFCSRL